MRDIYHQRSLQLVAHLMLKNWKFSPLIGNQRCIKRSQTGRGGIKWSLFSDNLTVYRGNKKIPTKKKKSF